LGRQRICPPKGRIDRKFPGFVRHLPVTARVTPNHFWITILFVFRSCGQPCGGIPERANRTCRTVENRRQKNARQSVSRVLSAPCGTGRPFLWDASHDAPHATNPDGGTGTSPRSSPLRSANIAAAPIRSCSRWGLPNHPCCQGRGALLPHRFALARGIGRLAPTRSCTGGLFSVALSLGSPPPAVSRHRVPVEPGLSSTSGIAPSAAAVQLSGERACAPPQPAGQAPTHDAAPTSPRTMIPPPSTCSPA